MNIEGKDCMCVGALDNFVEDHTRHHTMSKKTKRFCVHIPFKIPLFVLFFLEPLSLSLLQSFASACFLSPVPLIMKKANRFPSK